MVMLGLEDYIVGKNVPASEAEAPLAELAGAFSSIPEVERSHENAGRPGDGPDHRPGERIPGYQLGQL